MHFYKLSSTAVKFYSRFFARFHGGEKESEELET